MGPAPMHKGVAQVTQPLRRCFGTALSCYGRTPALLLRKTSLRRGRGHAVPFQTPCLGLCPRPRWGQRPQTPPTPTGGFTPRPPTLWDYSLKRVAETSRSLGRRVGRDYVPSDPTPSFLHYEGGQAPPRPPFRLRRIVYR